MALVLQLIYLKAKQQTQHQQNVFERSIPMTNKVVMIDGNSVLFRAFYALPLLHNNKGVYTNAVYGFSNFLLKILLEENPTHMLVAYVAGEIILRHPSNNT